MPTLSVISIAKNENELDYLKKILEKQTFQDFEFIISTKGTIPEAWNDAILKAKGEYIVFTESDARPLNEKWLEEIVAHLEKNTVMKGLEIRPTNLNMCNLAGEARIFKKYMFDETLPVGEDSELFSRLKANGIEIKRIDAFPVIHSPSVSWKKTLNRAFKYGHLNIKILYLHGRKNMETVNTQRFNRNTIHPVSNRIRVIVENVLFLIGLVFGVVYHIPTLIRKKK